MPIFSEERRLERERLAAEKAEREAAIARGEKPPGDDKEEDKEESEPELDPFADFNAPADEDGAGSDSGRAEDDEGMPGFDGDLSSLPLSEIADALAAETANDRNANAPGDDDDDLLVGYVKSRPMLA